jgi:hypothetical protein
MAQFVVLTIARRTLNLFLTLAEAQRSGGEAAGMSGRGNSLAR